MYFFDTQSKYYFAVYILNLLFQIILYANDVRKKNINYYSIIYWKKKKNWNILSWRFVYGDFVLTLWNSNPNILCSMMIRCWFCKLLHKTFLTGHVIAAFMQINTFIFYACTVQIIKRFCRFKLKILSNVDCFGTCFNILSFDVCIIFFNVPVNLFLIYYFKVIINV